MSLQIAVVGERITIEVGKDTDPMFLLRSLADFGAVAITANSVGLADNSGTDTLSPEKVAAVECFNNAVVALLKE